MEQENKSPIRGKKFLIRVSDDMHKEIKLRATRKGITLNLWIIRAIKKAAMEEDKYN